ncbi:PLDc N-terminal domain-containing protein [Exiguobacterium antarcticum]|uniref:PLDc N-terminal domain-containing protein n=1 Tax=Exiguobacterium antarcticum TaxID=132920 RepID=UPI0030B80374
MIIERGESMNIDIAPLLEIDWLQLLPLIIPILFLNVLLIGITLLDWYKRKNQIVLPYMWLLIIVSMQMIGPILYLMVGRRNVRHDYDS